MRRFFFTFERDARADRIRAELGWRPQYDDLAAIVTHSLAWERKLLKEPWS